MFDAVQTILLRNAYAEHGDAPDAPQVSSLARLLECDTEAVETWFTEQRHVMSLPRNLVILACVYAETSGATDAVADAARALASAEGDEDAVVRAAMETHVTRQAQLIRLLTPHVDEHDARALATVALVQRVAEAYRS